MSSSIRYIDDKNGNHVFPVTHERAVRDSDGVTLETKLGQKQATIPDLSTIRSGAAAGATAVQPAALDAKQDVISDLQTIRSGAALGSTSVQPVDIENMVEAEPIGSIIPPVNPSEFVTAEEVSQLSQELNGIAPLTEYVGRLESTSAKISNISTYRYMVVPVSPGDVVKLTSNECFYYVVSTFTFNPTLPYNLVLANGETSKHAATGGNTNTSTMPADAAYIILRGTISLLTINDRDILKSLSDFIQETNGRVYELTERVDYVDIGFSQKFDGIIGNQFVGDLTTGKEIVASATKKYVVITVKGGQVFKYKRTDNPATRFYVVSEFTLNPTPPYSLVLASGETTYHPVSDANYEYSLTLPSDAKYILMQSEVSGTDYIPEHLTLDGVNLLNTSAEELGLTREVDASIIREEEGYYRTSSPYSFSATEGWYATPLIPVYSGDIIETNTTVNAPYNTVGHLCFDGDGAFVQVLQMTNGETEISQAMVDAGVRYIGVSFNKANTPSPSVVIERKKIEKLETDVSDLSSKVNETENEISVLNRKEKIEIVKNSTAIFYVNVYNKSGVKTTYKFNKYEKVWDSLTYLDGDGNTQTKTNFKSAFAWGNSEILDKDNTYIAQGNTNFICNVFGDTRHIGDAHGNEVLMVCKFFADGEEFNPVELTETKVCREFRWIWKSEVYAPNPAGTNTYDGAYPRFDTDGNPIVYFHHYMDGVLNTDNEMELDNRLCIKQDGLKFNEAYGAMLECNYGDFSQVCIANAESTLNAVSNDGTATPVFSDVNLSVTPNQYADKAVMVGNGFVIEQSINVISPKNATPNIHCQFYTNRLKNYLMPVKGNTWKVEDWQLDEFNTGDLIRVLTYRKIDI